MATLAVFGTALFPDELFTLGPTLAAAGAVITPNSLGGVIAPPAIGGTIQPDAVTAAVTGGLAATIDQATLGGRL